METNKCCPEPNLRGGRCTNCDQWLEESTVERKRTEHFYVSVDLVKGPGGAAFTATLFRGQIGHAFVPVYTVTRSGDAQRAHFAAIAGAGYVDHHGRMFRTEGGSSIEGFEVPCPE